MPIERIINVLALVTLVEMMLFIGLSASITDFVATIKDWKLVARGMLANYILVPLVTVALLLLVRPHPMVAIGFLILAVCPAGPYGTLYTAIAKGSVGTAAGLMVVLAGLSPILSPGLLGALARVVARDQPVKVNVAKIVVTLLLGQAVPLAAGLLLQHFWPPIAAKLVRPASQITKLLNITFISLVIYAQFPVFLQIRLLGFAGMLLLLAASVVIGWLAGGSIVGVRKAMTFTTAIRNNGMGMVIALGSFSGTPAVAGVIIYSLIAFIGTLLVALAWGRQTMRAIPGAVAKA